MLAAQYAAALIVGDDRASAKDLARVAAMHGKFWEDGAWLEFQDGSLYYASGGAHEIWRHASDFYNEYPDAVQE